MIFGIINNSDKSGYSSQEIDKIGNTLIYLCENINGLTKTQGLKYLYLLDEFSIKKFGIPFLGLNYEVWKFGPVAQEIFADLSGDKPSMLKDFIDIEIEWNQQYQYVFLKPKKKFTDDEFTENDMYILTLVVKSFKDLNASKLSNLTHEKNSLWYNVAKENHLLTPFAENRKSASNYLIDFSVVLDENKKEIYHTYLKSQKINRHYKNA
jgi:uncharacterized phage-associated protein